VEMTRIGRISFKMMLTGMILLVLSATLPLGAEPNDPPRSPASSAPPSAGPVRLLQSDDSGIVVELVTPSFEVQETTLDGKKYQKLVAPDFAESSVPGYPDLPVHSVLLGIPPDGEPHLRTVADDTTVLASPLRIAPVPKQVADSPQDLPGLVQPTSGAGIRTEVSADPVAYTSQTPYPAETVTIGETGYIRNQRFVRLDFHPFQFIASTGQVLVHQRLRVELTQGKPSPQKPPARSRAVDDTAFDPVLRQSLLNYDSARAWRIDPRQQPSSVPTASPNDGTSTWNLAVNADGMYTVTAATLQAAGVPIASLDPHTLKLQSGGSEVALYVSGEGDGVFNPTDFIVFYGRKSQSKYSTTNVYRLSYGGAAGLRMTARSGTPGAGTVPDFFTENLHFEQDAWYIPGRPMVEDSDHWYWALFTPPSRPSWVYTATIPSVAPGMWGGVFRALFAGGTSYTDVNPDHHIAVYVNDQKIGDVRWDSDAVVVPELPLTSTLVLSGTAVVRLVAPNDTGAPYDVSYLNWFEMGYRRTFAALNDQLHFSQASSGSWDYHISGFTVPNIDVYDVTDPSQPVRITGVTTQGASAPYELRFHDAPSATTTYLALATTQYLAPASIVQRPTTNLRSTANSADYLVITPADFQAAIQPLVDHRMSQGYRVSVIAVQSIYDEFNDGVMDPRAIRDFIDYAYHNWQPPAPSYVLLVGDGTSDPMDKLGTHQPTWIPPYLLLVDPWIGETAAENRFVTVSGSDNLPDLYLGRLPANSAAEVTAMVNKIVAYEQSPMADWNHKILFTTDNYPDDAGNFYTMSDDIVNNHVPVGYTADKVYLGSNYPYENPAVQARTAIINAINGGRLLVQYIGHGAIDSWSAERILRRDDISTLTNAGKYPVFLDMTCLTGYFIHPTTASIAETAVRVADKGAIASLSPTGFGVATGHDYLNRGFFNALFKDGIRHLGVVAVASKLDLYLNSGGSNLDLLDTFEILGDPALRLALPTLRAIYLPIIYK
jgi:hypothetical protein